LYNRWNVCIEKTFSFLHFEAEQCATTITSEDENPVLSSSEAKGKVAAEKKRGVHDRRKEAKVAENNINRHLGVVLRNCEIMKLESLLPSREVSTRRKNIKENNFTKGKNIAHEKNLSVASPGVFCEALEAIFYIWKKNHRISKWVKSQAWLLLNVTFENLKLYKVIAQFFFVWIGKVHKSTELYF
jgi:hypothetical protein